MRKDRVYEIVSISEDSIYFENAEALIGKHCYVKSLTDYGYLSTTNLEDNTHTYSGTVTLDTKTFIEAFKSLGYYLSPSLTVADIVLKDVSNKAHGILVRRLHKQGVLQDD